MGHGSLTGVEAAVLGLTRFLAVEWARFGIRVNAVTPGAFPREAQPLPNVSLGENVVTKTSRLSRLSDSLAAYSR